MVSVRRAQLLYGLLGGLALCGLTSCKSGRERTQANQAAEASASASDETVASAALVDEAKSQAAEASNASAAVDGGPAGTAPADALIDGALDRSGRKEFAINFRGRKFKDRIAYGRFARAISRGDRTFTISDLMYPGEPVQAVSKGDHGVVLIPDTLGAKPLIVKTSEVEFALVAPRQLGDYSDCFEPKHGEEGLFLGHETANGTIYYDRGWKWAPCGD